jgi:hypothetical protein
VSISRLNLIVLGSQVTASSDEVDVVVGVVVLLELDRLQLEACKAARRWKAGAELCELICVIKAAGVGILKSRVSTVLHPVVGRKLDLRAPCHPPES